MYELGSGIDEGDGTGIPPVYTVDVGEGMDGPGSGSSDIGLVSPCCWNGGAAPGGKYRRSAGIVCPRTGRFEPLGRLGAAVGAVARRRGMPSPPSALFSSSASYS